MRDDEFNYDNEIIEVGPETEEIPVVDFDDEELKTEEEVETMFEEPEDYKNEPKEKIKKVKETKIKKVKDKKSKNTDDSEKEPKEKKDNVFKKLKEWFDDLSKKGKIITLSILSLVLLLIIGVLVYFIFIKKDSVPENVIVEEENFRYENGKLIFLDGKKEIGEYTCNDKSEKKCYVAYLSNDEDLFDHEINVDYKGNTLKQRSEIYDNKYAFVYDEGKITLYDIENKKSKKKLNSIKAYDTKRDLVVFEDRTKKFGVMEFKDGEYEFVINAYYDYLGIINPDDLILVSETDKKQRLIDIDNKNLSKDFTMTIMGASKEHISARNGKTYNLYSYNFEELLSGYDYINFYGEYIGMVKDNKLYFVDSDLNKMHEEGIDTKSNKYNPVYKYDKKNKLDKTEVAFKVTVNKDNLGIELEGGKSLVVSLYEGAVSAKYAYINYFDGKLYFYSDSDKSDLLGSYECANPNKITSVAGELTNCNVYGNSNGVTGIYNNNFVFINDNDGSGNAILYSIIDKKKKATYSDIQFVDKSKLGQNVSTYNDTIYVIAKSASKNNYGVISLNGTKASNVVSFNYKSISFTNNYYLMQNASNKYSIWKSDFSKLSDEFDYVEMLQQYYVGINGKLLNLYRYDGSTNPVVTNVELSSTNYKNAYTINIGTTINIKVDGKEHIYDLNGKDQSIPSIEPNTGA